MTSFKCVLGRLVYFALNGPQFTQDGKVKWVGKVSRKKPGKGEWWTAEE
jgi:hypothetical protein